MEYPPEARGKCVNCGFLAHRILAERLITPDGTLGATFPTMHYEVHEEDRGNWSGAVWVSDMRKVDTLPLCFASAFDISDEVVKLGVPISQSVKSVIEKDRACPKWFPWTPGFSPQQHWERLQVLELEDRRREFEQRMEQNRREFEVRTERERRTYEKRLTWAIAIVASILAIGEIIATIAGLPNDSWFVQWLLGLFR